MVEVKTIADMTPREKLNLMERLAAEVSESIPNTFAYGTIHGRLGFIRSSVGEIIADLPRGTR